MDPAVRDPAALAENSQVGAQAEKTDGEGGRKQAANSADTRQPLAAGPPGTIPAAGKLPVPPEALASVVGCLLCYLLILHPVSPAVPVHHRVGLMGVYAVVPVLLMLAPAFYQRNRTTVLLLVRLAFVSATVQDYGQDSFVSGSRELSWLSLLLAMLSFGRVPVMGGWGALGWRLPLRLHIAVQLLHVAAAGWSLAPGACLESGAVMANASKLQAVALALDWPLRMMGDGLALMPAKGACLALMIWLQLSVAFLLPTAQLLALERHQQASAAAVAASAQDLRHARGQAVANSSTAQVQQPARASEAAGTGGQQDRRQAGEEEWWSLPAVTLWAAQMAWLALRITLQDSQGW